MKKHGLHLLFAALLFAVPVLRGQPPMQVWVLPSLARTTPNEAAGVTTAATLYAARGETESFQVIVKASVSGLSGINLSVSDLTGPSVIPASRITLYREHFMEVRVGSVNWNGSNQPLGPGFYPDALIPFNDPNSASPLSGALIDAVPYSLPQGRNAGFWVDVEVPRAALPGVYKGKVTVGSNLGSVEIPVALTVWSFSLPEKPSLATSFAYQGLRSLQADSVLLQHRLSPLILADCISGPRSSCLGIATTEREFIDLYGMNATNLRFWSGAYMGHCAMSPAPLVTELLAAKASHQPDLALYNFTADEITGCTSLYPTLKAWARNLHDAGIKNLVTMAPDPNLYSDDGSPAKPAVDIWAMLPLQYQEKTAEVFRAQQLGMQTWTYNSLVQDGYSPKWLIDFHPLDYRIQAGFLNQALGMTGLLYWRVDLWPSNPWIAPLNNVGFFSPTNNYPGEGMLVYPGNEVGISGVVPSMRLKQLRDGVDDYDYVTLLRDSGRADWALEQVRGVARDFGQWTKDHESLLRTRNVLGAELDRLGGGQASGPANVSVTPSSGSGVSATFVLSTSHPLGASAISSVNALFNSTLSGSNACWIYFDAITNSLTLAADNGTSWSDPVALGSPSTLANSICSVSLAGTKASISGNMLVLTLPVAFTGKPDTLLSYMRSADRNGRVAEYSQLGTWTIPVPVVAPPPTSTSVSPTSGTGTNQIFTFGLTHPTGLTALTGANILFNNSVSGSSGCWIYFDRTKNTLSLANDTGGTWSVPSTIGKGPSRSNSRCTIYVGQSSVTMSLEKLILKVSMRFNNIFPGTRNTYVRILPSGGYVLMGTWTVK